MSPSSSTSDGVSISTSAEHKSANYKRAQSQSKRPAPDDVRATRSNIPKTHTSLAELWSPHQVFTLPEHSKSFMDDKTYYKMLKQLHVQPEIVPTAGKELLDAIDYFEGQNFSTAKAVGLAHVVGLTFLEMDMLRMVDEKLWSKDREKCIEFLQRKGLKVDDLPVKPLKPGMNSKDTKQQMARFSEGLTKVHISVRKRIEEQYRQLS